MSKPSLLPKFDWSIIDLESFRGPGLSFPIKIELLVAPAFTQIVMGALNDFHTYFRGSGLLDKEGEGFPVLIQNSVHNKEADTDEILEQNDLAIRMTFICDRQKVAVLSFGKTEDLITRH